MMKGPAIIFLLLIATPVMWAQNGVQISGGLDARYTHENHPAADDFKAEGLFLNLRKVWSDEQGDRWIGVAQVDADDNFSSVTPYQVYLQYKGPLGKWNIRAGHFLLPFGLLATYDTERLVLQGLEQFSLGIRHDTGAQIFGHFGDWDYAVSVTDGLSDIHFADSRANPVLMARMAYVQDDWQIGVSTLIGHVLADFEFSDGPEFVSERRAAIDMTKSWGPLTIRAEGVGGTDDGRTVGGGIILADYALTPKWELNTRYAWWHKDGDMQFVGLGLTYQFAQGLYARVGDNYEFGKEQKNALTTQLYFEFSKQF
ncbi:MAG TPA: hypothetical protein VHC44_13970 [Verrucomicrobiae bacterium]|nr:hypothetical protein [Verrucomicrobiae bacterium]